MKSYIYITKEGCTYQPNSINPEPDIENCQVIGFANGNDENEAFRNLIKENKYLLNTRFNELRCIELKNKNYSDESKYFCLDKYKTPDFRKN